MSQVGCAPRTGFGAHGTPYIGMADWLAANMTVPIHAVGSDTANGASCALYEPEDNG